MFLFKDCSTWKQVLEDHVGCLRADEQDSAVLPGVALVNWSQGDPWASYTQLPLVALKDQLSTLAPLLLRTLGWKRRPDNVTIQPRSGVGRMLLSVWEENVDWACPGGRQGEVLTFSDPAQGDDSDYTWIGANGRERTVKRADMQVLLPVLDPRARVKPSSPLHGVCLRVSEDSTHLAEVTLQQAAEAVENRACGVLYYRLQNVLAEPGEPWLSELLSAEGRQQATGEGLELWAASVSEPGAPLVVARKEAEGMGEEAGEGSSGNSSTCGQRPRWVVYELGIEERRGVMEKALGKKSWRHYMYVDEEAQAGDDGGGLSLAPDALLLLVHHHYLAVPFSRQLLQQADRAIVELCEVVGRQQEQEQQGEQDAAAGDAGAQPRAPVGAGAGAGAQHAEIEDNGAGQSGSQQQACSCPRAPKRAAQIAVEESGEDDAAARETAVKRARQANGTPSGCVAAAAADVGAQKQAAGGASPQQQQQQPQQQQPQQPPATVARPPAMGAAPHAPPPLFQYPLVGTRAAQVAGESRRVRVLEDSELHLAERDEAEQQLERLRQEHDAMQQEMRLGRAAAEDHVRELQAQLGQLQQERQRERDQQQQELQRERGRADAAEGDARRMREQRDQLHAQRECMRRQRDRMQGQGGMVQQEPEAMAAANDMAAKLQDELDSERARAAAAEQEADGLRVQGQRRYEELQRKYEELCDKHLQLLVRHEEVLGDRGVLQRQLTAAEQRAVAVEREAIQAQRSRAITA